ncbi:hypothetical protein V6N13_055476 [Hibiscus sabdariffa]|uniref:Uncharacterized protein n=1 Tax=Hibiscus sabdariffa TaxID=183260 RepID=A0ABR2NTN1_9ROSI
MANEVERWNNRYGCLSSGGSLNQNWNVLVYINLSIECVGLKIGKEAATGGVLLMNDGETQAIFTGLGFFRWLTKLGLGKQAACGVVFHSGGMLKCREAQVAMC